MQPSTHASPLLNRAIGTRAKNVELRQKITQLQTDIHSIEKDISTLTVTYDDLVEQCRILREKQTDKSQEALREESEKDFRQYIHDIETYLNNKQWKTPSMEKSSILCKSRSFNDVVKLNVCFAAPKISPCIEADHKIPEIPIQTLQNDLNHQLASVENWLMESAITDHDKQAPILVENQQRDDETDDLYKDLILPTLSDEMQFDENNQHGDFVKSTSPEDSKQQRLDKNQRRFALMRQLAEKSNKSATKKLL